MYLSAIFSLIILALCLSSKAALNKRGQDSMILGEINLDNILDNSLTSIRESKPRSPSFLKPKPILVSDSKHPSSEDISNIIPDKVQIMQTYSIFSKHSHPVNSANTIDKLNRVPKLTIPGVPVTYVKPTLFSIPKPSLQLSSFYISEDEKKIDKVIKRGPIVEMAKTLQIPKPLEKQYDDVMTNASWGSWRIELPKVLTRDETIAILNRKMNERRKRKQFLNQSPTAAPILLFPVSIPASIPILIPASSPISIPTSSPISIPATSPISYTTLTSVPTTLSPTTYPSIYPTSSPTILRTTTSPTAFPTLIPTALPTSSPTSTPTPSPTKVLTQADCYQKIALISHNTTSGMSEEIMNHLCSNYCANVIPNQQFFNIMCSKQESGYCYPRYLAYLEAIKNPTSETLDLACEDISCLRNMTEVILLTRMTEDMNKSVDTDLEIKTFLKAMHSVDMTCLKVDKARCYPIIFQMASSSGPVCSCWTAFHEATEKMFPLENETIIQKNAKDFFCSIDPTGTYCGHRIGDFFTNNPCPELNGSNPVCSPECQSKFASVEDNCCLNSLAEFSDRHIGLHYHTDEGYVKDWIQNTCQITIPTEQCSTMTVTSGDTVAFYPDISVECYKQMFELVNDVIANPTQEATSLLCNSPCFAPGSEHRIAHDWLCTKIDEEYCYPNFILLNGETSNQLDHACGNTQCNEEMVEVLFMMHNGNNPNLTESDLEISLDEAINGIDLRCLKVNNEYCSLHLENMDGQNTCECFRRFEEITKTKFPNDVEVEMQHAAADFFCAVDTTDEVSCGKKMNNFFATSPCPTLNGTHPPCSPSCQEALLQVNGSCCFSEMIEFGEAHANAHFGTEIGYVKEWMEDSCKVQIPPLCQSIMPNSSTSFECHEITSMDTRASGGHIESQSCMKVNVSSGQSWIFDFEAEPSATIDDIVILVWPSEDCSILPDISALLYTRGPRHKQVFTIPPETTVVSVVIFPYQSPFLWKASLCHDNSSDTSLSPVSIPYPQHECSSYCNSGIESVTYRYDGESGKDLILKPANMVSVNPEFEKQEQHYLMSTENVLIAKSISNGFTFTMHPPTGKTFQNCALEFFIVNHSLHLVDTCCKSPTQLRPGNIFGDFQIIEAINGDGMKMCGLENNNTVETNNMPVMNDYSILAFSQSSHTSLPFEPISKKYKKNHIPGLLLNQNLFHVYSGFPAKILPWIYGDTEVNK